MRRAVLGVSLSLALLWSGHAVSQELPAWVKNTTFSGLVFGDAYWVSQNHAPAIDGADGFWIRRVFLTFDQKLSDQWSARLRLEANGKGDFQTSVDLEPFLKDAFIRYTGERHQATLGLQPTPTMEAAEKLWGYRAVEKTLLDLQRFGLTRDTGIAASGSFDAGKKFRYFAMLGNGTGTRDETNEGKRAYLALDLAPSSAWLFEVYGDFEDRPGATDRTTLQVLGGYQGARGRIAVQLAQQKRDLPAGGDETLDAASIFGAVKLTDQLQLLARYDKTFDPNADLARNPFIPLDGTAKANLVILGVDYKALKNLSFIPNIEYAFYEAAGHRPDPDDDLFVRLTFFWQW